LQTVTNFQNSFTDRLGRQFATKLSLTFPPHQKGVATLPCKIFVKTAPTNVRQYVLQKTTTPTLIKANVLKLTNLKRN